MKTLPYPAALVSLLAICLSGVALPAAAWSNHALGTWQALSATLASSRTPDVRVESLESFLTAEGHALEPLLRQEEQWASAHVPEYPQRPEALAFVASADAGQNRQRFLAALRINPQAKLPLYLQLRPGADVTGETLLPWSAVTTLQHSASVMNAHFLRLQEAQSVAALEVVASASDEPDYGLDLGLWENNPGAQALGYGFGKQPFGNPALEYSSQAPFHMGFFHESPIVYKAAGFLRRTYPQYRIHLYQTLASHALRSGHPYWGWRFAGWALHYVQDLTQPYHTKVLPGVSVPRMLWINALDLMGAHGSKQEVVTRVSNRHAALENYQYRRMRAAYQRKDSADALHEDALLQAARDKPDDAQHAAYTADSVRQNISLQSHDAADATDAALEQLLPEKTISDPHYVFGETEPEIDLFAVLAAASPQQQARMTDMVSGLMHYFGAQSRSFMQTLLPPRR